MWQTDVEEMSSFFYDGVDPKEAMVYYTPNSFLADAELCRDGSCGVRHVYPIDVVFSVHKKGPLQIWSPCFAPDIPGVHYRDKKDVAEDEVTVQKRHLSELDRRHRVDATFGHTREHSWFSMQKIMSKDHGTYLNLDELSRLKNIIKERLGTTADATLENKAEIFGRVFAHLMFDRVYFEAASANGFEAWSADGPPFSPLTPAGLTVDARKQWVSDFKVLVAYAQQQERYAANKSLAKENSSMEAKLQRMKATLSGLTSKVETKLESSQGDRDLVRRLSTAVTGLQQHYAKANTTPDDVIQPEVALLIQQLKKLDQANGHLQGELAELRKQVIAARQMKKAA